MVKLFGVWSKIDADDLLTFLVNISMSMSFSAWVVGRYELFGVSGQWVWDFCSEEEQITKKRERKKSGKKKKKKVTSGREKGKLTWQDQWDPICSFNYGNAIKNKVMETENTWNVFSVSITYYSKIKELSDGNKNWKQLKTKTKWTSQLWVSPFLSYKWWKQSYELWKS